MSQKNKGKSNPLAHFGLEIPNFDDDDDNDTGEDDDLEAELQNLLLGKDIKVQKKAPVKKPLNLVDIEKIAMDYSENISNEEDEEGPISDEDELLAELHNLTAPSKEMKHKVPSPHKTPETSSDSSVSIVFLQERLDSYRQAVEVTKQNNDISRSKRYGRAVKTLEDLLKSAKAGSMIDEKDVPPAVAIPKPLPKAPSNRESLPTDTPESHRSNILPEPLVPKRIAPRAPPAPSSETPETNVHSQLTFRRDQYKLAAVKAKKSGDTETALKYVKIAKKFDAVITAEASGQPIDLSDMPPPPPGIEISNRTTTSDVQPSTKTEEEKHQNSAMVIDLETAAAEAAKEPVDANFFKAPPQPNTILEALQQRLEKYCSTRDAAKAEGNTSKARRVQRIAQQYEAAIKSYKAGRPVNFEELPCPPGFSPIPLTSGTEPAVKVEPTQTEQPASEKLAETLPSSKAAEDSLPKDQVRPSTKAAPSGRNPKIQRANTTSILDKQLRFLLERQKLFRQAALESKKNGDIQQAKEYLRMSKGFDSMIEATKNGLPIDATTIPTPPQLEAEFVIIEKNISESSDNITDCSSNELFSNLEKELQQQIEMCTRNKDHFMRLGDVTSGSKFEKLALETKKDLVYIQHLWRMNEPVPLFHYEIRLFSFVQCNTDLTDNEIEISVERGINFPGKPDELDTYVKVEFAVPPENPQRSKTHTIKDTNNPTFQQSFRFEFNRKSRSQIRQFKKQVLKFDVFSKGWFFKGDSLLGSVLLKLTDLETKCSIHSSFDLMDGRKPCGGKLEIKCKIRDPLLVKQVEEVKEKWLVIGS